MHSWLTLSPEVFGGKDEFVFRVMMQFGASLESGCGHSPTSLAQCWNLFGLFMIVVTELKSAISDTGDQKKLVKRTTSVSAG